MLLDTRRGLLVVANTKGIGSRNGRSDRKGYNSHDHAGSVSFVRLPSRTELDRHTLQVERNNNLEAVLARAGAKRRRVAPHGPQRYRAEKSLELDLDDVDRADEDTFNRILWHAAKGYDVPYPAAADAR